MPIDELLSYFEEWNDRRSESSHNIRFDDHGVFGSYRGMRLYSVFQPIFDANTLKPVAYEALLRVKDDKNRSISPADAFSVPVSSSQAVYFDRLCRIVHALNFVNQSNQEGELFLNVSGRHLLSIGNGGHGEIFERLLGLCGLKPSQIILEVLEAEVDDLDHLCEAVDSYRKRGYRVAIDDFGCKHSNFDRLWRLTPDIIKLDRSLIVQGELNDRARKIIPKLIDIIHDLGAKVVCEGIENEIQQKIAVDAGTDLVQGYYHALPSPELIKHSSALDAHNTDLHQVQIDVLEFEEINY